METPNDGPSFLDGLRAEAVGNDRFTALPADWFGPQAFGGIVLAHAVNAALQTVDDPSTLHSAHAYFLRPVATGEPVRLRVDRIRDGRSFATRQVTTEQRGKPAFTLLCSFHAPEEGERYQLSMPADVVPPESLEAEPMPDDAPYELREAPTPQPASDGTYRSTRRCWFRVTDPLPDDPVAHLTVAAFLSDMTGTSFRPHNLGEWGTHTDASLDHAMWFHHRQRMDEWLLYDLQAIINHGGRSVIRGAMYSRDGQLRFSIMQELLIRRLPIDLSP